VNNSKRKEDNTGSTRPIDEHSGRIKTLEIIETPVNTPNAPTLDELLYVDLKGKRPLSVYVRLNETWWKLKIVGEKREDLLGSSGAPYCQL